ncbi:hypothetical protein K501DRAFT_224549 [Backusella circina FSU 941]|nr:hypothetical protein K501DRAFT_224549 [Backusella circina FSU 941]
MVLAAFPLIIRRWKRSNIHSVSYDQYTQLAEYLTEDIFQARIKALEENVKKEYPHVYIDSVLFGVAILLVIVAAVFSIASRAVGISLWYPLLILIVPACIGLYTTRRRNTYYKRLEKYYSKLHVVLKEFNTQDVTRQVKWVFRTLKDTDTAASMHLEAPISKYYINFVINVVQINTETELASEGDILPAYGNRNADVVLDVAPEPNPEESGDRLSSTSHLPPAYERTSYESCELEPLQPPPAYLNNQRPEQRQS